jgi:glycosyltransferase involved in cell wall biosynthesis
VPAVSVALPVYNAQRYLRSAIDSVLSQSFHDFELLILDDGSTDRSPAIMREIAKSDERVRVITRENRGIVQTLNELIEMASGKYIARMDADDICTPERFQKQVSYLEAHPSCVALGSRVLLIDEGGRTIGPFIEELTHREIDDAHLSGTGGSRICHPTLMMRRDAAIQAGKYSEDFLFAEDMAILIELAELGQLQNLPDILLHYRQHSKSIAYQAGNIQRDSAHRAAIRGRQKRGLTPLEQTKTEFTTETRSDAHRKWAWWALNAGNIGTARVHAMHAMSYKPFCANNLKTLLCAWRGY